jgi:hypothetical protein
VGQAANLRGGCQPLPPPYSARLDIRRDSLRLVPMSRQFRAPLRRVEYFDGCALYRDSRRKAEVYFDPLLLPIGWDPTWNQWKHLVATKIGVTASFFQSGKWDLVKCETALPVV